MSISDSQRRDDKRRTLRIMVEQLADHHVHTVFFEPTDTGLNDVLQTTWRELLDDNLIDDKISSNTGQVYRLTARGWLRGLTYTASIDSPELRDRCIRLAKALKGAVKGRHSHYDEFVSPDALAAETGLPEGWIYNALDAQLLGVVFPKDRWDAHVDLSRSFIRVSPTFGLNQLFDDE